MMYRLGLVGLFLALLVSAAQAQVAQWPQFGQPGTAHSVAVPTLCVSSTAAASSTAFACATTPGFTPGAGDTITWQPGVNDLASTLTNPTLNVNGAGAKAICGGGNGGLALLPGAVASGAVGPQHTLTLNSVASCWVLDLGTRNNPPSSFTSVGGPQTIDTWFDCVRNIYGRVCGVRLDGTSLSSCWQTDAGCSTYGPQFAGNRWPSLLGQWAAQASIPIYGSGIQPCIGTVISAAALVQSPFTTTGTIANASTVGPSQATGAQTGGSICQMTAGATITFPAGHTFYAARFYCGETSANNTIAVTIGGTSVGNICGSTTGSATPIATTITNPGATTAAAIVMTATGTGLFYGLELQYTSANYGLVIHNAAVGAANSYFFGANTTQNLAFNDLFSGTHALTIIEMGVNDQAGAVSPANFTTNINFVLNHEQAFGSSTLLINDYVWSGTGSTNTSLRPTVLTIAQSTANPTQSDFLDWQDIVGPITPAQAYAMGCLQSDLTHETDLCSLAFAQQMAMHLFPGRITPTGAFSFGTSSGQGGYNTGYEMMQDSTDAQPNFRIQGCFYASLVTCGIDHGTTPAGSWMWGINGATAQTNVCANGGVLSPGSYFVAYNAANSQTPTGYPLGIDYTTHLVGRPCNVLMLGAGGTGAAYTNATTGTFTNVSDGTHTLQFALNASETGSLKCALPYSASATTVGAAFKWAYTGTMTTFVSTLDYDATTATAGAANVVRAPVITAVATQQPTTPTVVAAASTTYMAKFDVSYAASTAGILTLTAAPSAAGTLTIPLGAKCVKD